MEQILKEELNKAILKLKMRKAASNDGITPEMIKHLDETGKRALRNLLNEIITTKKMARDWNIGSMFTIKLILKLWHTTLEFSMSATFRIHKINYSNQF